MRVPHILDKITLQPPHSLFDIDSVLYRIYDQILQWKYSYSFIGNIDMKSTCDVYKSYIYRVSMANSWSRVSGPTVTVSDVGYLVRGCLVRGYLVSGYLVRGSGFSGAISFKWQAQSVMLPYPANLLYSAALITAFAYCTCTTQNHLLPWYNNSASNYAFSTLAPFPQLIVECWHCFPL